VARRSWFHRFRSSGCESSCCETDCCTTGHSRGGLLKRLFHSRYGCEPSCCDTCGDSCGGCGGDNGGCGAPSVSPVGPLPPAGTPGNRLPSGAKS
jgi:hypothetical protein